MKTYQQIAAYGLFGVCIAGILMLHAVPAFLAGLLSFVLTRTLLQRLSEFSMPRRILSHELQAALLMGVGSVALLVLVSVGVVHFLGGESPKALMLTLSHTLQEFKQYLPVTVRDNVPDSLLELKARGAETLKTHADALAGAGTHAVHSLVLTLVGWLVGVLVAVRHQHPKNDHEPLFAKTWFHLWDTQSKAFSIIARAQAKIAGLNAALAAVFLMLVMPACGWDLPYTKTLVLATFLCGLLPVVGNLVANTLTCLVALSVAFPAAIAVLCFMVVIHKLEYLVSARIQGHQIGAAVWELLIILFVFETWFGPAGMVAAPILYAFVKVELKRHNWLRSESLE